MVDYTYDKDGLPLQIGAESLSYLANTYFLKQRKVGTAQVDYTCSEFGELSELRARTGADLLRVQYTRDDLGRITQAQEALQGTTTTYDYAYDLLGQIVEVRVNGVVSATYSYDANSNRIGVVSAAETVTSAQITLNADDQLTRYGSTLYQYNAAGQRTRKSDGAAITQYTYGVMGELQQVVLPDGRTLTYQYDALKRRIGRKINGTTTHRYLWAGGLSPVAEVDANGVTTTTYVYGTGINVPDYMVRGGVTYMFVRDHLGSVRFVVNSADNSVVQELRYDTFGQVLLDTNPGFQPFGFAGGLYDPDTSLIRFGARDYDAQIGRWTARDPLAFGGGQANLYIYVGNDPANLIDPEGELPIPALIPGAWVIFEFSMSVYDVYDAISTLANPCADRIDKAISVFGLVVGAIAPGGGYGTAGQAARKACFTAGTLVTTGDGLTKIENVRVGDRAAQLNGEECFSEPIEDPNSCAVVTIEFANEDGLRVELMRSSDWLEKNKVEVGGMVRLALVELDVDGDGHVVAMSSCTVIAAGPGCVVTGTFERTHDDVLELSFVDSTLVLQLTSSHPLWSEDRNDWVRADQLRVGEYLRSESGPLEISSIQRLDGIRQVFNLEVAGNHTYLVGADAVLSHNVCGAFRRFIDGVHVVDNRSGKILEGTVDLKPTIDRIRAGGSFPYRNDGSVFRNDNSDLPFKMRGYYREFVHPTPGLTGPGPQRII